MWKGTLLKIVCVFGGGVRCGHIEMRVIEEGTEGSEFLGKAILGRGKRTKWFTQKSKS